MNGVIRMLSLLGGIGHWELLIILVVVLLVFGARVPDVMRSLGKGVTQFKRGLQDVEDEIMNERTLPEKSADQSSDPHEAENASAQDQKSTT